MPSPSSENTSKNTCATCRYAATDKQKKIIDATGFGDQMMFEDEDKDEPVYSCRAYITHTRIVLAGEPGQPDVEGDVRPVPGLNERGPMKLCEHAGKVIGIVPITCVAWTEKSKALDERTTELDRLIAAREARISVKDRG